MAAQGHHKGACKCGAETEGAFLTQLSDKAEVPFLLFKYNALDFWQASENWKCCLDSQEVERETKGGRESRNPYKEDLFLGARNEVHALVWVQSGQDSSFHSQLEKCILITAPPVVFEGSKAGKKIWDMPNVTFYQAKRPKRYIIQVISQMLFHGL